MIFRYVRMSPERFNYLADLLRPLITKEVPCRIPISVEERFAVTLRYLATGNSQRDLVFSFKLGRSTINQIITEVCTSLWDVLSEYVSPHSSSEDWKRISNDFCQIWNMLHCIGAIYGKHACIRKPSHTGTLWHNYKGFFSMVLLVICDARYCFSFVDVGEYGSNSDSGVLKNSNMGRIFDRNQMGVPDSELIEGTNYELPYFLVGDEIFPLQNWLMCPYSGNTLTNDQRKIFNYRLFIVIASGFWFLIWGCFRPLSMQHLKKSRKKYSLLLYTIISAKQIMPITLLLVL